MKYVRYEGPSGPEVGVQLADGIVPTGHRDIRDLIEAEKREQDRLRELVRNPGRLVQPVRMLAPVADRAQLLYAGGNYPLVFRTFEDRLAV